MIAKSPFTAVSTLVTLVIVGVVASCASFVDQPDDQPGPTMTRSDTDVVGMWVTADGNIRQELLPDGRYDEARGTRESAYTGRYTQSGTHIDYVDDTGFTATGDVRNGVLYHEHLVPYREGDPRIKPR